MESRKTIRFFTLLSNVLRENHNRILVFSILLVLMGGAIYGGTLGNALRYVDEREYVELSKNLVLNHSYSYDGVNPTAFRPPAYPILLSLVAFVGGGINIFRFVNFLFLAGTIIVVRNLLKKTRSQTAGTIGVLLILGYPVFFYAAGTLFPQTIGSFLLMCVLFILFAPPELTAFKVSSAGILLGISLLFIPGFSIVVLFSALYIFVRQRSVKFLAMLLTSFALVLTPWVVRNYSAFHGFIPVSTNSGVNLRLGNSEMTSANLGVIVELTQDSIASAGMNEFDQDHFYRDRAIEFVVQHPMRAMKLYVAKFLNYFNFRNEVETQSEVGQCKDILMLLTYGPLLIIAFLRVLMTKMNPLSDLEKFCLLLYVANAFFQAIFFTRIRFRLPFDFLLILVVASFLDDRLRRLNIQAS